MTDESLYKVSTIILFFLLIFYLYRFIECKNKKCYYIPPTKNKAELIKNIMDEIKKKIDIEIGKNKSNTDDEIKVEQIDNNINVTITTSMRDESNAVVMNNVNISMDFTLPNLENASEYDLEYILYKKDKDFIFKLLLVEYGYNERINL